MTAIANVLQTEQQIQLQQQLSLDRKHIEIAFDLAQEMIVRGEQEVRHDPNYQRHYREPILNLAVCLVQMSRMHLEQEADARDPLRSPISAVYPIPLPSGRVPGGGMEEADYQARQHRTEQ